MDGRVVRLAAHPSIPFVVVVLVQHLLSWTRQLALFELFADVPNQVSFYIGAASCVVQMCLQNVFLPGDEARSATYVSLGMFV